MYVNLLFEIGIFGEKSDEKSLWLTFITSAKEAM